MVHIDNEQASKASSQDTAENASPKMDPTLKAKWVEALRSGEFKQARGKLQDGDGYCCLGVLCKVAGYGIDTFLDIASRPDGTHHNTYGAMDDFGIDAKGRSPLINLNDRGEPFPEIADYIEANL